MIGCIHSLPGWNFIASAVQSMAEGQGKRETERKKASRRRKRSIPLITIVAFTEMNHNSTLLRAWSRTRYLLERCLDVGRLGVTRRSLAHRPNLCRNNSCDILRRTNDCVLTLQFYSVRAPTSDFHLKEPLVFHGATPIVEHTYLR